MPVMCACARLGGCERALLVLVVVVAIRRRCLYLFDHWPELFKSKKNSIVFPIPESGFSVCVNSCPFIFIPHSP